MIHIYHGEDFSTSRNNFNKEKDKNSITLDASELDNNLLNQLMSESSLFAEHKKLFIENLFSRKAQKNFDELIKFIKNASHLEVFIWADKEISNAQTKDLGKYKDNNFKIAGSVFAFIDSIYPKNKKSILSFHQTLSFANPEFIFTMIVRQFRLMIGILSGGGQIDEIKRIQPWQKSKITKQAVLFGEEKLNEIYKKLKKIDKNQKTGASKLNLIQEIDMLLLEL